MNKKKFEIKSVANVLLPLVLALLVGTIIIVMHEGKITGRLMADEADEETIGLLMMGGHDAEEKGAQHE